MTQHGLLSACHWNIRDFFSDQTKCGRSVEAHLPPPLDSKTHKKILNDKLRVYINVQLMVCSWLNSGRTVSNVKRKCCVMCTYYFTERVSMRSFPHGLRARSSPGAFFLHTSLRKYENETGMQRITMTCFPHARNKSLCNPKAHPRRG